MNHYQILQIDKKATTKEIKSNYYQLARKYHPDKNNGISDENFKKLSEAYSVLSNPKKRYIYDMKSLFKDNLGEDFIIHFSDQELEILHNYYMKLSKSTEFRFLRLLFNSLPNNLKTRVRHKFKGKINSESLLNTKDIKYIYAESLAENFEIYLNRSLKDSYLNICKEIIIVTNYRTYYLFVTHSDYSLRIYLKDNTYLTIHIQTVLPEKYSINGNDIYYNHRINLYEYYFTDLFPIVLPNDFQINLKNSEEFNNSVKIPYLGLKGTDNKRGNLYIYKNLDLMILNKEQYKEILHEIFN